MKSTDKVWEMFTRGMSAKEILNSRELSVLNMNEFRKVPASRSMEVWREIEERGETLFEILQLEKNLKTITLRGIHERKLRLVFQ